MIELTSDVKTGFFSQLAAVLSKPVFTSYQNIIITENLKSTFINVAQA